MRNKTLDRMIPYALKEAEKFAENGKIKSKYFTAVANFGASVLQSGVYATKLFYEAKEDKRKQLPTMISTIIKEAKDKQSAFEQHDKQDILDAVTALKLAVRTFEKVPNGSESNGEVQDG